MKAHRWLCDICGKEITGETMQGGIHLKAEVIGDLGLDYNRIINHDPEHDICLKCLLKVKMYRPWKGYYLYEDGACGTVLRNEGS